MFNYSLPYIKYYKTLYIALFNYIKNNNALRGNISIDNFYVGFPCKWQSGFAFTNEDYSDFNLKELIELCNFMEENNLKIRLLMTNSLINDTNFEDKNSKSILEYLRDKKNVEVISNSDFIDNYIKENFGFTINKGVFSLYKLLNENPSFTYKDIFSFIKQSNYCYTIPPRFNQQIPLSTIKTKSIIIPNEGCPVNCPYKYSHHLNVDISNLSLPESNLENIECVYNSDIINNNIINNNIINNNYSLTNAYLDSLLNLFKSYSYLEDSLKFFNLQKTILLSYSSSIIPSNLDSFEGINSIKLHGRGYQSTYLIFSIIFYLFKEDINLIKDFLDFLEDYNIEQ